MPGARPNCNWRDWANLTAGPADLIAERVLADDVANYLRFRAVCSSWRRCTASPHAHGSLDRQFHPRQWIMLQRSSGAARKRRRFLNVSTGEHICVNLPELRCHFVFGATSDGLIVLCDKNTYVVRLLNPLTRQLTDFPEGTTLLPPLKRQLTMYRRRLQNLRLLSSGPADDSSTVALHFGSRCLFVAQPSSERWRRCGHWKGSVLTISTLSFAGRFYCVTEEGIMVVDVTADSQRLQLVVAAEVEQGVCNWPYPDTVNLVDNGGELILVNSKGAGLTDSDLLPEKYEVHRVDLDSRKMIPTQGLRGRAVFVSGKRRGLALSVPAGLSSSIGADTVYRCSAWADGRPRIDAYHLLDGSIQQDFRGGEIVDYLSRYVNLSEDAVDVVPAAGPRKRGSRKRKANPKVTGNEWIN
ncbi:unnamed protein product [Alopecurus aequalis]